MTSEESQPRLSEDWLAVLVGAALLLLGLAAVVTIGIAPKEWVVAPALWNASPLEGLHNRWFGLVGVGAFTLCLFGAAVTWADRIAFARFARGFVPVFLLALVALVAGKQEVANYFGLGYALWALVVGLAISNTVGCPAWLTPAVRVEFYAKVGLVLLGAEVLMSRLLELGPPGVCVAWIVTPIVLCTTFWFGQRVLRLASRELNIVISADMSVCGISAAIATAAACRAKKEELSVAVGLSLVFTVMMMVAMPPLVALLGLGPIVGGAWIGGTVDSTGAVAVAASILGEDALFVAATIKMIQNILVGFVAFGVATYWVTRVEGEPTGERGPAVYEIWRRFPKFVIGFLGASIVFSLLHGQGPEGEALTASVIGGTKTLRTWCFCLAFTCVGLGSDFRVLGRHLQGGKPLVLYVCGQTLNLCLTLAMSWVAFHWWFPGAIDALTTK